DLFRSIEQARNDSAAFAALYDCYIERIYVYVARQTGDDDLAKDITAATFEKALRNLRRYRWQGVSFGAWLFRIAHNEIVQHYRKQKLFASVFDRRSKET